MLFKKNKSLDFLAIGDTATDAFIRLKDASVHCSVSNTNCELCMKFGDKIPYEFSKVIAGVGNSANAAVSAMRLGLSTGLVSNIGADAFGKEILESFKKQNIDITYITSHIGKTTNYHYVLWYQSERTILIKHEKFEYIFKDPAQAPRWMYLSSLADGTEDYHHSILKYLLKNPSVKFAFQPGTFQIKLGLTKLLDLYKRSDVFVCNVEEARIILGDTGTAKDPFSIKSLLKKMSDQGPKITLITDGPTGAYAYDGTSYFFMPPYPDTKPPYERTGAGDAFASTFVVALTLGKTMYEALTWAPINSMSVVQSVGAQEGLLTKEDLEKYLKQAPKDYLPKTI